MEWFFDNDTIWNFYDLEWIKIFKLFGIFMIWDELRYLNFLELKKLECY